MKLIEKLKKISKKDKKKQDSIFLNEKYVYFKMNPLPYSDHYTKMEGIIEHIYFDKNILDFIVFIIQAGKIDIIFSLYNLYL